VTGRARQTQNTPPAWRGARLLSRPSLATARQTLHDRPQHRPEQFGRMAQPTQAQPHPGARAATDGRVNQARHPDHQEACQVREWVARTVQKWIADGLLPILCAGYGKRGVHLLREKDVKAFTPPPLGKRPKTEKPAPKKGKAKK
jgi:hypothetical protein